MPDDPVATGELAGVFRVEEELAMETMSVKTGGGDGGYRAVVTTGIYCRPSCSARPKPENVRVHPTRASAERAGFRPCKRCRPDRD